MTKLPDLRRPVLLALALSTLACASHAAAQDSPRALLERGAFAEEHERNFDDAATLYARAAEAAHAANDAATEKEANAAKSRVLTRQGKAPAADAQAASELPQQALRLLHDGALLDPKTDAGKAAIADLAIAGSSIVPALEQMFNAQTDFTVSGERLSPNPMFAIHALAAIRTPEATAALARCYESPDPLLRHAIVMAVIPGMQRPLLERAARDPVDSVADAAISRLRNIQEPALADLMELAVRRGSYSAGAYTASDWLAGVVPERALTLAEDRGIGAAVRADLLAKMRTNILPASVANASRLLALGRDPDTDVAKSAQQALAISGRAWQASRAALREPVGTLIAAELERAPTSSLVQALGNFGPANTPQVLSALMRRVGDAPDAEFANAVVVAIMTTPADVSAASYDAWLALACTAPASWQEQAQKKSAPSAALDRVLDLARRDVPLEALVRGARDLPADFKQAYARALSDRVQNERRKANASGALDPGVLNVAFAWYGLDREKAANDVAALLGWYGDVEQLPATLEMARSADRAREAARTLISRSPKRAAEILSQEFAKLADSAELDEPQRHEVELIGALPADMALTMFRTWWPRMKALQAKQTLLSVVAYIDGPAATAELLARYGDIANDWSETRKVAVMRFGNELYEPAIPLLGEALKDPDDLVRAAARKASEAFKQQRQALEEFAAWTSSSKEARDSVAELTKLLESPNRDVVLGAIKSLGAVKAKTALPALVKLLEKNDPELKKAVQDAIAKIGE